jgi:hypothetical protein
MVLLVACGGAPIASEESKWDQGQWDTAKWQ